MGGDDQGRNANVIIPDIGAGPYWYVDPRAGQPSTPAVAYSPFGPVEKEADEDDLYNMAFANQERQRGVEEAFDRMSLVHRTNYNEPGPTRYAPQERADAYDKIRYKGMVEPPNVDHELAESTGIFELNGMQYILPTRIEGTNLTPEEIMGRFMRTGEHLGAFENVKDARFFESTYLFDNQSPQKIGF